MLIGTVMCIYFEILTAINKKKNYVKVILCGKGIIILTFNN